MGATHAFAQDVTPEPEAEVEAVVVTGSFISRAESAALPVEVLTTEELAKKGSPSLLETIKSLTVSSGVLGESNQFGSGSGQYGRATVNLRGLGSARTLVLFNGHRFAGDDLNVLPTAAVGRIEVLKEGASTTYGSDAIGGVLNFITRKNLDGVEVAADYRLIQGSDGGDYGASILAGKVGDNANILASFSYQHRSDLPTSERDWAVRPFEENPEGGWTGGTNPSRFTPVNAGFTSLLPTITSPQFTDVGCVPLGGVQTADSICRQQFIPWDNLVDKEDRYQAYLEVNSQITSGINATFSLLYAKTDVEGVNTTPSFTSARGPSVNAMPGAYRDAAAAYWALPAAQRPAFPTLALSSAAPDSPDISNYFFVPSTNPGFAAYCVANASQCPAGTEGALFTVGTFRPFLAGGNPAFGGMAPGIQNTRELTRLSGGFDGSLGKLGFLGDVAWRTDLTYSQYDNERNEYDTVGNRLQLAMRGLGGPNCPYTVAGNAGNAALGCSYFNPFSNAIAGNPLSGAVNPGYNPAVANTDLALIRWFHAPADQNRASQRLFEGNLIFNGQSTFSLPGGDIAYAAGLQWRREGLITKGAGTSDQSAYPCTDSLTPGLSTSATCSPANGPYIFLGQINNYDLARNIYATFVEFSLPLLSNLDLDVAGRFEDYGSNGGSTTNPKVSLRWQATDTVALRGSYSTTFRAPGQTSLTANTGIGLRNVLGSFRAIATTGNPDLKPETADTYNLGAVFQSGGLRASVDYYNFKLKDVLGAEVLDTVVSALFPNGAGGANNCLTLDAAYIASHFEFSTPCSAASLTQVKLRAENRGEISTDGIDASVEYRIPVRYADTAFSVGATASYILNYDVNGVRADGYANGFGTGIANSMPNMKAELFGEATRGIHNLRLTMRHIGTYVDDRAIFTLGSTTRVPGTTYDQGALILNGQKISAQNQFDLAYRVMLPKQTTLSLQVQNLLDKDPPFARAEMSYDPMTGNPLGRTFQVNVRKAF